MLPEFIIIGAMKGGTTSLYYYIASHPDTEGSSIKETNFFKTEDDFSRGLSWYKSMWNNGRLRAFEASPNYAKCHIFPGVPKRMCSVLPDIKLIYVVRDPIERIISHYIHNYSRGRESRSLSEAVRDTRGNYVLTSKYYYQIQAFLTHYSEDQILVVQSEKLINEPAKVMGDVSAFLDLADNYNEAVLGKRFHESRTKTRKSSAEILLMKRVKNRRIGSIIMKIGKLFNRTIEKPVLNLAARELLKAEIAPDVEQLRKFTGRDFSDWSL